MSIVELVAALAASIAAVTDLRERRIPNWLTGGTVLVGLVANAAIGGPLGLLVALGGAALGLAVLLPFYALRGVGGGDVKLLAALGAVLGAHGLISVVVYGALVGGLISLAILARRRRLMLTLGEMFVLHGPPSRSGAQAPYAVAIAAGVYLSLLLPPVAG
jgi:prepilin peptidase CpaA